MPYGIKAADVAAIKAVTDLLPDAGALSDVATIKAVTDLLPNAGALTDLATLAEVQKGVAHMDFWSNSDDVIALTSSATDTDLPDVVVSGLPAGVSLVRVICVILIGKIENTNVAVNAIDGAQSIRVKKSTGAWGVDDVAAIDLADNLWGVAASTREGGDVRFGDNDVKGEVDGDATYNLRFENALVDENNLQLNDVMVGIRLFFTTG